MAADIESTNITTSLSDASTAGGGPIPLPPVRVDKLDTGIPYYVYASAGASEGYGGRLPVREENMAALLGLVSSPNDSSHEEICVPGLDPSSLLPDPEFQPTDPAEFGYGSSTHTIVQVVYALAHVAAQRRFAQTRALYHPSLQGDFDLIASFVPPTTSDVVDAIQSAVELPNGQRRVRIDRVGTLVLNVALEIGGDPDISLFDQWYGPGTGSQAMQVIDQVNAERIARDMAEAENRRIIVDGAPVLSGSAYPLLTEVQRAGAPLTGKALRVAATGAYSDWKDRRFNKGKIDISDISPAVRLVATQHAVAAAILQKTGRLPDDYIELTLEAAETLLTAPDFDRRRGIISKAGGIDVGMFNPRARTLPIHGKDSLDVVFQDPGLTRTVIESALSSIAENVHRQPYWVGTQVG